MADEIRHYKRMYFCRRATWYVFYFSMREELERITRQKTITGETFLVLSNFLFSKLCEKGEGGALVSKIFCFGKFSEKKAPEHLAHFGCGLVWQRYCVIKLYKKKA